MRIPTVREWVGSVELLRSKRSLLRKRGVSVADNANVALQEISFRPDCRLAIGAACSIVTRDVLPSTLVAGNPARVVRELAAP